MINIFQPPFFSKYTISKEDHNLLELKEKNTGKIFLFLFLLIIIFLLFFIASTPETTCDTEPSNENNLFITISIAIYFVVSLIDIVTKGYMRINKDKKKVHYFGGWRKLLFSPLVIPFSQIRCVKIETHTEGDRPNFDVILLQRTNGNDIIIDRTHSEIYVNEISSKIARYIGCEVFS